jgi:hypothetical protein
MRQIHTNSVYRRRKQKNPNSAVPLHRYPVTREVALPHRFEVFLNLIFSLYFSLQSYWVVVGGKSFKKICYIAFKSSWEV